MPAAHATRVASAGEALVDLIEGDSGESGEPTARPGGSPFNVAVGLARLGLDTSFAGRLSTDAHGRLLHDRLAAEGIGESLLQWGPEPTAVAVVGRVGDEAVYDFRWTGTADRGYDPAAVSREAWARLDVLHVGSAALGLEPGGGRLLDLTERLHGSVFLSFDPNVRREVVDDWPTYLDRVRRAMGLADLVKASEADLRELGTDTRSPAAPMGRAGPTRRHPRRGRGDALSGRVAAPRRRGAQRRGRRHDRRRRRVHGRPPVRAR